MSNTTVDAIISDLKKLFEEYYIQYEKFDFSIHIGKETDNPYLPIMEQVKNYEEDDWIFGIIRSKYPSKPAE